MKAKILGLLTVGLLTGPMAAQAVPFNVTATEFQHGSGYGVDASELAGNLLDVRFSTAAFLAQNFALSAVGQSFSFNFGTIDLAEPGADSGILATETDNLDITAKLTFGAPTGVVQTIFATGVVATPGSLSDPAVDYLIDWTPVTVLFGNGGSFRISLADMAFSSVGSQSQFATVTLLSLGDEAAPTSVPEPGTLALLGLGLAGLGFSGRRRAA